MDSPKDVKVRFQIELEVTQEFLRDIICTAVEGGINYWAFPLKAQFDDSGDYLSAPIEEIEAQELGGTKKRLNLDDSSILRGIQVLLGFKGQVATDIVGNVMNAVKECDAGYIDATAADCIVQAAMFGEIVYG